MAFDQLPAELIERARWVNWREELRDGKPTKVPVNPNTGSLASVTDPNTWGTFDAAVSNINAQRISGLGFVLGDGITGIDLDDPAGDEVIQARHAKIAETFATYQELSPSGRGIHALFYANGSGGKRRSKVEIYFSDRFFTVTGNRLNNFGLTNQQALADILSDEIGAAAAHIGEQWGGDQTASDEEVLTKCSQGGNGELFRRLFAGDFSAYPSQSEADQALVNILCFYSDNREQIARLFHMSSLGQRQKAHRVDYLQSTISKGFDQKIETVNLEKLRSDAFAILSRQHVGTDAPELARADELPPPPAWPEGLLGGIASFVYGAAPYPVPEIAITAAIGLLAGITGRSYNVNGAGLNLYMLLVAPSGRGKEAINHGLSRLMNAVIGTSDPNNLSGVPAASTFAGPAFFSSAQGLARHLGEHPSFVSVVGEFGLTLRKMSGHRANAADVELKKAILDAYGKSGSGNVMQQVTYSKKENNAVAVKSPAVTIVGETTPNTFYELLTEDMIAEGLLPRFMVVEYLGERVPLSRNIVAEPHPELVKAMRHLCTISLTNQQRDMVTDVRMSPEAQQISDEFEEFSRVEINKLGLSELGQLWNRAHVKLLKLAALYAIGVNWMVPTIERDHILWAKQVVMRDVQTMLRRFERGEVGEKNFDILQRKFILRVARELLAPETREHNCRIYGVERRFPDNGIVPMFYLSKRCAPSSVFKPKHGYGTSTDNLKKAIASLLDDGHMHELPKPKVEELTATRQRAFWLDPISFQADAG